MSENPYEPPKASLGSSGKREYVYYPGWNRVTYIISYLALALILGAISYGSVSSPQYSTGVESGRFAGTASLVNLLVVPFAIWFASGRLRNIGSSRWWSLLQAVPLLNFLQCIYLASAPAGFARSKKYDLAGMIVAGILLLLLVSAFLWAFTAP